MCIDFTDCTCLYSNTNALICLHFAKKAMAHFLSHRRTHRISVWIETLGIGRARQAIFLCHTGRVGVKVNADTIGPEVLFVAHVSISVSRRCTH